MSNTRTRLTSIGLAAALATIVAAAANAATTANVTQTQTADVAATLEATFPSSTLAWGALDVGGSGTESASQLVNVKSNKLWGVKLASGSDMATGRMRLWNGLIYGTALTNALEWRLATLAGVAQSTSYAGISSTASGITSNQAITDDNGVNVGVRFRQKMSYADGPAPSGQDYRILVVYDAAQGY